MRCPSRSRTCPELRNPSDSPLKNINLNPSGFEFRCDIFCFASFCLPVFPMSSQRTAKWRSALRWVSPQGSNPGPRIFFFFFFRFFWSLFLSNPTFLLEPVFLNSFRKKTTCFVQKRDAFSFGPTCFLKPQISSCASPSAAPAAGPAPPQPRLARHSPGHRPRPRSTRTPPRPRVGKRGVHQTQKVGENQWEDKRMVNFSLFDEKTPCIPSSYECLKNVPKMTGKTSMASSSI